MGFTKDIRLMRIGFIIFLFVMVGMNLSYGQHTFHRNYPVQDPDDRPYNLDGFQMKNGNYVSMFNAVNTNENTGKSYEFVVISAFGPKGNIEWNHKITDTLTNSFGSFISIFQGKNDSIYFISGKAIGSISEGGKLGRVFKTEQADENTRLFYAKIFDYNKSLFHLSYELDSSLVFKRRSYDYSTQTTSRLSIDDAALKNKFTRIHTFKFNPDSTIIMAGIVDSTHAFIAITDTLGNVRWSRKYAGLDTKKSKLTFTDATMLPDSSFLVTGYVNELNITNAVNNLRGIVIRLDKYGKVLWSKRVLIGIDKNQTHFNRLVSNNAGDFVINGIYRDAVEQTNIPLLIKIDVDGKIIWKEKYDRITSSSEANLFKTQDDGFGTFVMSSENGKHIPSFIKTDGDGKSSCEEGISDDTWTDISLVSDTLKWLKSNYTTKDSLIKVNVAPYIYSVPVLSLQEKTFCPNEPIKHTFNAKIAGATNYKWSTGEEGATRDTLTVFDKGQYSVTVTVGEGVCYMLCDTAELKRYTLPSASIALSLGNWCTNGKQTLTLGYGPGHPDVKSISWSTGEKDVRNIEIATLGTYSVTVVDACNETAKATISVGEFPTKITKAEITDKIAINCLTGFISGTLEASGNSTGLGDNKYLWSNGEITNKITINQKDTLKYKVTITDFCGNSVADSLIIERKGKGVENVTITKDPQGDCENITFSLNAVTNVIGIYKYLWSTNDTLPKIIIDKPGTYSVTVTDLCGNKASNSINITDKDFEPQDLVYANVFYPDGLNIKAVSTPEDSTKFKQARQYDLTFGPVNKPEYCIENITKYEFYVYNRFGQLVFESDNVLNEWDGTFKGELAPSETYLWVVRYTVLGAEKVLKGSITLLRI
ncbi:MAG TPA: gliding motility-associated C-terminal domain-containing protein [Saprospiraceae bacterium]|jgi:gliding motility-associated-like protein|nr:gliding motility-associated C-terminal domain-containing protein [Saprospiraceae bacterium]HMT70124.1 gliding motility-associated C-terminal domain-containing protein [Saprospiraceae bacterium]